MAELKAENRKNLLSQVQLKTGTWISSCWKLKAVTLAFIITAALPTGASFADATPPTGSISINDGAAYTNSTAVTLTLSCTDADGCAEMQFSTDNSSWSSAETYTTGKAWTLVDGDGAKTVYAKYKDAAENWSEAYSAAIDLVTHHTVTPSASANGSISPTTPQTIDHGATTQFIVTPNAGYTASVGGTCGGLLSGSTYTTSAITADCTVAATFALSAPIGVGATPGNAQTTINWTASAAATSYNIYYRTTSGVTTANGVKITGATSGGAITGLTNGTPYYFVVTVVNAGDESAVSSEVSAVPQVPAPETPAGLSAIAGNAQVSLTWSAVATIPNATITYTVYRSTESGTQGAAIVSSLGTASYTDTTPTNGTTYYYSVAALDAGGSSPASAQASATPQIPAPGTPRFAYVANMTSNDVSAYTINPVTGALTAVGPAVAAGSFPRSVTVDPTGKFAYAANYGSDTVSTYTIDQITGVLTAGTEVATGYGPFSVTVDPTGKFAYVANRDEDDISVYTVDQATGALTAVGSAVPTGSMPWSVTVDPAGKFAYVPNSSNSISVYAIDQTTGALTSIGTATAGTGPRSVAVDPSGKFAYVPNYTSNNISVYAIDQTTGTLNAVTSMATLTGPSSVTVNPNGKFAYVANTVSKRVSVYELDQSTGALNVITSSATGTSPQSVAVDPSGRFAYVANSGSNNVSVYSIDQVSGALTAATEVAAGTGPRSVAVTAGVSIPLPPPSATASARNASVMLSWIYVAGATSYNVYYGTAAGVTTADTKVTSATNGGMITGLTNDTTYYFVVTAVNASGESVVSVEVSATPLDMPAPDAPTEVSLIAGNREVTLTWTASAGATSYNVYYAISSGVTTSNGTKVANATSGSTITGLTNGTTYYFVVTAVSIWGESAISEEVSAKPMLPPGTPRFAYVANYSTSDVSVYTINQSTGELTAGTPVAAGAWPWSVTVDPSGRFAYVANAASNNVSVYTINQATGALTAGTAVEAGNSPFSVVIDPSGRFAYVANRYSDNVSVYTIDQSTGALTAGTAVAAGTNPYSVAVDPSGRFAYAVNYGSNNVSVYTINQATGALTAGTTVVAGTNPYAVTVDPSGRFVYAANYTSDNVSIFTINQTTGALTGGTVVAAGLRPTSVAVDPSGRFVYVANYYNSNGANISVYTIDQATGALSAGTAVSAGQNPDSITVDPTGKFAYVANFYSNIPTVYSINQTTGALTTVTSAPYGADTNPTSITVTAGVSIPLAPPSVSAAAGNSSATLRWTYVAGAMSYNVYYRTTAGVTIANGTKVTNAANNGEITGLTSGTTYYFVVTAVNSTGESAISSEVSVVTPVSLTVTPGAGTNGSISPNTPQAIIYGTTTQFTVTPNAGYTAAVGGTCGGSLEGTIYTTNAITENCTVSASFTHDAVNGSCGTSNSQAFITAPASNLCDVGAASGVSGSGPWTWTCGGQYSGTDANCSAAFLNPPVVAGVSPTNSTKPTWTWATAGGGSGTYQYQLDNSGWTTTTATAFTPVSALTATGHILSVQEQDAAGNWTTSGLFAIQINTAAPTASKLSVTPTTYLFGVETLSDCASSPVVTFTARNSNSTTRTLGSVSIDGLDAAQFTLGANSCSGILAANSECTVEVKFCPTSVGSKSANLLIPTDDSDTPYMTAFLHNHESATGEARRRMPSVLSSLSTAGTMTSGGTYTITWSLLGYDENYQTNIVFFNCAGVPAGTCGDSYGTNFATSGNLDAVSVATGEWSYLGVTSKKFNYSYTFTAPTVTEATDIVVRIYRKSQADIDAGSNSLSLLIPGNLSETYYDSEGRRIVKQVVP